MVNSGRIGMVAALAVGGLLLLGRQVEARYRHFEPPPIPPTIVIPPPSVIPPPAITTQEPPPCHEPPGTPPGTTQHAPEPATLISGLLGAGILGLFSRRRKKQVVMVD
jgi:LPXTG-motif cell wall-anchored protein